MARKEVYAGKNEWFAGIMNLALRDMQNDGAVYEHGTDRWGWSYTKVWLENFNSINPAKKNPNACDILFKFTTVDGVPVCKVYIPGFDVYTCNPADAVFDTICNIINKKIKPNAFIRTGNTAVPKTTGRGSR